MKSFTQKTIEVEIILGKGDFSAGGNTLILNAYSGEKDFNGLAQRVYASRFYHAIMAVEGITNLALVEIALSDTVPSSFNSVVSINGNIEPVISRDNIFIEVV